MKTIKKLMTLVLSIAMVLAMSVTAFAEDATTSTYKITITNATAGHTYEAYQIFVGELAKKDNKLILSNMEWGNGITSDGITNLNVDAKTKAESLTDEAAAVKFTKDVAGYLQNPVPSNFQNSEYVISLSEPGYYLVKDKDNTLSDKDDFYTAYIMQVVGNVRATPKGDKPTLEKQIKHNDNGNWGVVGDNQIGDTVEFRTITTVPDTQGYTKYNYIIHDKMSEGLTSNVSNNNANNNIVIKVNDDDQEVLDQKYYNVEVDPENSNKFSITVNILQAIEDGIIESGNSLYTYYTGTLNSSALIYDEGKQNNIAYLEYSNNPNKTDEKGKTPEKKVYDWTFKMEVNKIAGDNTQLDGAKFVLSRTSNLGNLKSADIDTNAKQVQDKLIKFVQGRDKTTGKMTYTVSAKGTVYEIVAGDVIIKGLDDAVDYYLYETKAPEGGYNKLEGPTKFKISAEYNPTGDECETVKAEINGERDKELKVDVINNQGSTLPSTGGMGTTIFYVVGTILVLAAVVLLITKKRMHADK